MIGVGVNFSSETRNIEEWVAEELGWKREAVFRVAGNGIWGSFAVFVSTTLDTSGT
jgi:hypothetical protein